MKNQRRIALFLIAACFAFPLSASANDDAWNKLGRGFCNIVTSPLEILNQPVQMAKTERWPIAMAGGFFKGIGMMLVRLGTGVYEIVTFPLPCPNGYEPILKPEFIIPMDSDRLPVDPVSDKPELKF